MKRLSEPELREFFKEVCQWKDDRCLWQREGGYPNNCCDTWGRDEKHKETCAKCRISKVNQPDTCRVYFCTYALKWIFEQNNEGLLERWHRFVEEQQRTLIRAAYGVF